jgi:hypothetical protein
MWDKIQVVIEDNGFERGIMLQEIVDVFGNIENNNDKDEKNDGKEEGSEELPDDIVINGSQ